MTPWKHLDEESSKKRVAFGAATWTTWVTSSPLCFLLLLLLWLWLLLARTATAVAAGIPTASTNPCCVFGATPASTTSARVTLAAGTVTVAASSTVTSTATGAHPPLLRASSLHAR